MEPLPFDSLEEKARHRASSHDQATTGNFLSWRLYIFRGALVLVSALLETPVAQVSGLWRFRVDNRNHLRRAPGLPVEPLRFSVRLVDSTLIAILSGELDIVTAPRMVDHLETYRYRATRILYDLGGLTFLDGFGLRSLLGIFDGDLDGVSIANPTPPIRRVLEALGHGSMIEPWSETLQTGMGSIGRLRVDTTAKD